MLSWRIPPTGPNRSASAFVLVWCALAVQLFDSRAKYLCRSKQPREMF
jgi:hypothetical protein